jgi:hypothetical protein
MNKLSGETLVPLAFVLGGVGTLVGGIVWLTSIDFTARAALADLGDYKQSQNETNRLLLAKLDLLNDKLGGVSQDVAVIKRAVKEGDR